MSASRPPDGERFEGDDPFDPIPFAANEDDEPVAWRDSDVPPNPLEGMTPDERVEYTREGLIRANPESADHWCSEEGDAFLRRMDAIENGPYVSTFKLLIKGGAKLPSPESIADEDMAGALWAVIGELAGRRVFLAHTDHLSDRELYEHLWFKSLREGMPNMKFDIDSAWIIDIIGACSEEDLRISNTYYSSDEQREHWMRDFPKDVLPPRLPRPYDRDRYLPQAEDAWRERAAREAEESVGEEGRPDFVDTDDDDKPSG